MVATFSAKAAGDGSTPNIATTELGERLRGGERIVLVDVRTPEEQTVSMIPGALSREAFEAEVLPSLAGDGPKATELKGALVVPYCTVGYRSGLYAQELVQKHGLNPQNVRNGEGVIMWTFDGGALVRPLPTSSAGEGAAGEGAAAHRRAPTLTPEAWGLSAAVFGRRAEAEGDVCDEDGTAEIVREVHVYGKPWDCAADGIETKYFTATQGVTKHLASKIAQIAADMKKSPKFAAAMVWLCTFLIFYLFFTPACGVMYDCGCRLAMSKWGQVEMCNVFDDDLDGAVEVHRCPWCSCAGISCILVGSDRKAFNNMFLLDLLPDGCFITALTVVALSLSFKRVERLSLHMKWRLLGTSLLKTSIAVLWFVVYCLIMGGLFFAGDTDYPRWLGFDRLGGDAGAISAGAGVIGPIGSRFLVNASQLHADMDSYLILDARAVSEVRGGVIPGAVVVPWRLLAQGGVAADGVLAELRPASAVAKDLAAIGADGRRRVVVYGAWENAWGEEGRLFWTLEYLGVDGAGLFCLDGGVKAWTLAGFPLVPVSDVIEPNAEGGAPLVVVQSDRRATTTVVNMLAGGEDVVLLDVRERVEFDGVASGDPYGADRSGHIPHAVYYNWREHMFQSPGTGRGPPELSSCGDILESLPVGAASSDIIAYCTGGIRSGFVYMVLRGCGFPQARNYDGSWWAWSSESSLPCWGDGPGCKAETARAPQGTAGAEGGSGQL